MEEQTSDSCFSKHSSSLVEGVEDPRGSNGLRVDNLYCSRVAMGVGNLFVVAGVSDDLRMYSIATPLKAKFVFGYELGVFFVVSVGPGAASHYVMENVLLVSEHDIPPSSF